MAAAAAATAATADNFCLKWNDFEANLSSMFRQLRDDQDFFDVTLATDEDEVRAHRVVLSACSPHLRQVLRRHARSNPSNNSHLTVYLRGVRHSDLVSILEFMYNGEVNVSQDDLNSFLSVAEDLSVRGLTQNTSSTSTWGSASTTSSSSSSSLSSPSTAAAAAAAANAAASSTPNSLSSGATKKIRADAAAESSSNHHQRANNTSGGADNNGPLSAAGSVPPLKRSKPSLSLSALSSSGGTPKKVKVSNDLAAASSAAEDKAAKGDLKMPTVVIATSLAEAGGGRIFGEGNENEDSMEGTVENDPENYEDDDDDDEDHFGGDLSQSSSMAEAIGGISQGGEDDPLTMEEDDERDLLSDEIAAFQSSMTLKKVDGKYQCLICARESRDLYNQKQHILTHMSKDGSFFDRLNMFARRYILEHDSKTYTCLKCRITFHKEFYYMRNHFVFKHLKPKDNPDGSL